jgi:hypothetical protein
MINSRMVAEVMPIKMMINRIASDLFPSSLGRNSSVASA